MLRFALILLGVLSLTSVSFAQPNSDLERARTQFEDARDAYEQGDYQRALTLFRSAYAMTHSPDILYNIATCADRLRQDEVALEAYRGYLEGRPDSSDRQQVEARIQVILRQLDEARADRERSIAEARAHDAEAQRLEAEQELLRRELAERPTVRVDSGPAPWAILGVGLGVAAVGAVLVIVAEVDSACVRSPGGCVQDPEMPRWEEVSGAYDRVPILQGVGYASIGVGAAGALIGLVWGLVTSGGDAAPAESVSIGPRGLGIGGRF